MHDFRAMIRQRLADAKIAAGDERSVVEEMNAHLEDRYAELRAKGSSEAEALRSVEAELMAADPLQHAMKGLKMHATSVAPLGASGSQGILRGVFADVRYALRTCVTAPAFALSAILALGVGTGAATAVFSLVNGVLLRPLPYAQPDRLVMLHETNTEKGLRDQQVSPVSFMDFRAAHGAIVDAAAWWKPEASLTDPGGAPLRVPTVEVSDNLFDVMGVHPAIGRGFAVDSTLFSKVQEAVISDRLWRSRFGADRSVVGRTIRLNGFATTIIGVMPPSFHFPDDTDVWWGLSWNMHHHNRGARFMGAVARLAPDVTIARANEEIHGIAAHIAADNPSTNKGWSADVVPLTADIAGIFRPGLIALFGAATLLLLIACLNVANLLLARAATRNTEVAIRSALGASRARILRQLLTESLLLAVAGTAVGFVVASVTVRAFMAWSPIEIPRGGDVSIDGSVLLFSGGVAVLTTLLFGLVPAIRASRADLQGVLRQASRSGRSAMGTQGRGLLVIGEVALSVALLCGAGLLVRTVSRLVHQDTGVHATDAVAVDVQLPDASYDKFDAVAQYYDRLTTALRANPRITHVGISNFLPLESGWPIPFERANDPPSRAGSETNVQYQSVDGGYFPALGVTMLRGRNFTDSDRADTKPVVIINEAMAKRYWPNEDPIGKVVRAMGHQIGPLGARLIEKDEHEIIGVVSDVKNVSLTDAADPALYSAAGQFPFRRMYVLVSGHGTAAELSTVVRTEVQRLDPNLPIGKVTTIERALGKATDPPRFLMLIMIVFASIAVLLAAFGIYGLLAYMVTERGREFGIRMAMGARRTDVLRMVLRQGLVLGAGGALLGVLCALLGTRLLGAILYGVQPRDPLTIIGAAGIVCAVTLAASTIPALRATRVEPMRTLRE